MKKARPILLLVDNRTRDSHGMLLVYYWLRHLGCKVVLCNKRNWLIAFQIHRPSVVVLPHAYGGGRDEFLGYLSQLARVVIIPTEGAIPVQEDTVKWASGQKRGLGAFTSGLFKVFVWGPKTAQWLLEAGVYREDQVVVSGTPRLDPYLAPRESRLPDKHRDSPSGIGFATDYGHINTYNKFNIIDLVDFRRHVDAGIYYDEGRNIEDFIWFLTSCLRVDLDLIENWAGLNKSPIYFRPDPFELVEAYNSLMLRYPGFYPSNREPLWQWLTHICCLVTSFSSTGIEALLSGIPVLSPMDIIGDRLGDHMRLKTLNTPFRNYYWRPKTCDEAIELLLEAHQGNLTPSPDPQGFAQYLKDFYDWPREESSSMTIAKELANIAGEDTANGTFHAVQKRHGKYRLGMRWATSMGEERNQRLLRKMKYAMPKKLVDLSYVLNDIRRNDFKAMQRYHFYPWHRRDFRQAWIIWESLRTNLDVESENSVRLG